MTLIATDHAANQIVPKAKHIVRCVAPGCGFATDSAAPSQVAALKDVAARHDPTHADALEIEPTPRESAERRATLEVNAIHGLIGTLSKQLDRTARTVEEQAGVIEKMRAEINAKADAQPH